MLQIGPLTPGDVSRQSLIFRWTTVVACDFHNEPNPTRRCYDKRNTIGTMMDSVNLHESPNRGQEGAVWEVDPSTRGIRKGRSVRRKWFIFCALIVSVAICGGVIGALSSSSGSSDNTNRSSVIDGQEGGVPAPSPSDAGSSRPGTEPQADITDRDGDEPAPGTTSNTPAPTTATYVYLKSIVPDGGFAFDFFPESYQRKALEFVQDSCDGCSQERIRQRYVLACIYYATNGVRTPYTDYEIGVGQEIFAWHNAQSWWSEDECSWAGISCNKDGLVEKIDLHDNFLTGKFPEEVTLLKDTLEHLDLESNLVYNADEELDWLGKLTNLKSLNVAQTPFEYSGIPPFIGKLTKLVHLDVSYSLFFGPLQPEVFANLHNVQYLYIGGNSYNSSIPSTVASMKNLLYLYAEYSDIQGDLSFLKTGMSKIFELWADKNPKLTGSIPSEIGQLITLESLSLTNCGLTGTIPDEIGNLYRMQQMWLFGNQLKGEIPGSIANMTRMYRFEVENNQLEGDMPDEICDLFQPDGKLEILEADCDGEITNCPCCTCCGHQCTLQPSKQATGNGNNSPGGNERQRRLNFVAEQRRRRRLLQA